MCNCRSWWRSPWETDAFAPGGGQRSLQVNNASISSEATHDAGESKDRWKPTRANWNPQKQTTVHVFLPTFNIIDKHDLKKLMPSATELHTCATLYMFLQHRGFTLHCPHRTIL